MKIQKVIFDLDNTLLDTEKFKIYIDSFLISDFGLSVEEAKEVYVAARDQSNKVVFSQELLKEKLKDKLFSLKREFDEGRFDQRLQSINWKAYLLPGAIDIVECCQQRGVGIALLSLGYSKWQLYKVENSGLGGYFNAVRGNLILTSQPGEGKVEALKKFLGQGCIDGDGIVVVNDKPDETFLIMQEFKKIIALLREEIKDDRYRGEIFDGIRDEFQNRIFVSDRLDVLQIELEKLLSR